MCINTYYTYLHTQFMICHQYVCDCMCVHVCSCVTAQCVCACMCVQHKQMHAYMPYIHAYMFPTSA